MSIFNKRRNITDINTPDTKDNTIDKKVVEANSYNIWRLINNLRDVSQAREYRYAEYDIMAVDVIIRAALDMYTDDATQLDENTQSILTIVSDNQNLVNDLSAFLRKIHFEDKIYDLAYSLAKYGNKYWKIYLSDEITRETSDGLVRSHPVDIDHIEEIDDPACVIDLYYQGEPVYFAENKDDRTFYKGSREFDLYDHNSFIHFYIKSSEHSEVLELLDNNHTDENGDPVILKYKVLEGESLIEGVRVIYRILKTLEDSLLAARLAKAEYVRIFNIEVGDSGTTDTRLIVNKVKKIFDSTVSMDIKNGTYNAVKQPRAWADPVFNSVSNGKGAISIDTYGGDFEVKSIVDIDYFNNKLFAGLRIPKAFLGFEEALPNSLDNESTLIQLDIRYGKFIAKLKNAILQGTTELCDLWLQLHNRSNEIGKYKIVYSSPSSSEELNKLQGLQTRVDILSGMVQTITSNIESINSTKLIYSLIKEFIPYENLLNKIEPIFKEAVEDSELSMKINKLTKEAQIKELENPSSNETTNFDNDVDNLLMADTDNLETY